MQNPTVLAVRLTRLILLAVSVTALLPARSLADGDWDFKVAPYLWTMAIRGKLGPAARPASINMDSGDVSSFADAGFTGMGEVTYRDNWTLLGDIMILKLSQDGITPTGDPVSLKTDLDIYTLAAAKRVGKAIDLYAGARWYGVDSTASIPGGPSLSGETSFVDPVIGIRLAGTVSEKVGIKLTTDFGGFGVGSEISWQVVGSMHYAFSETWSGIIGYRALDVDYSDSDAVVALGLKGILLGLGISF